MSDTTPSQAEGERDDEPAEQVHPVTPHTTPSQAEGERDDDEDEGAGEEPGGR
ncbi:MULTISPECIES: hypothetical protein [Streptomyces]|uniref:hypothetical protein n=1 Tax=Streptomyces TaxID=1883 RepID=UPI00163B6F1A|nr:MULTISPECIES: hypothetical protein [Streptomyces]MBC2876325.1 hypothetical protein [Streptomyces sp. TYQ1024]UBI35458.1 hypothetical protein K7I03_02565 [Streptomyces mobaraensis]UKW28050.1 hypothetical protein MCU78_02595 [Streptomyces sp. TYQ1024]